jgi:hypothetical protein
MSMFVHTVTPYQQLQNWRYSQMDINIQQMGAFGAGTDFSTSIADATTNSFSTRATLAADQALARTQQSAAAKAAAKSGKPLTHDQKIAAAQAAGKNVLASLGLDYSSMFAAPSKSSTKSSSGAYVPPTNAATGHGFVASSAASLNALASVNVLA